MDIGALFIPLVIGVMSLFAATLFIVTVITHEPHNQDTKPPHKR
jgi:hypothetical protein